MTSERLDAAPVHAPLAQLEQSLIDEFVRARGYDPATPINLPDTERRELLKDASVYASSKLTEVESRAQFVHEIHEA